MPEILGPAAMGGLSIFVVGDFTPRKVLVFGAEAGADAEEPPSLSESVPSSSFARSISGLSCQDTSALIELISYPVLRTHPVEQLLKPLHTSFYLVDIAIRRNVNKHGQGLYEC